jgi:hypothetical protein
VGGAKTIRRSRAAAWMAVHAPLGLNNKVSPWVAAPSSGTEINILAG